VCVCVRIIYKYNIVCNVAIAGRPARSMTPKTREAYNIFPPGPRRNFSRASAGLKVYIYIYIQSLGHKYLIYTSRTSIAVPSRIGGGGGGGGGSSSSSNSSSSSSSSIIWCIDKVGMAS